MQNSYSRDARFSPRVLEAYARAGLPEAFTVRAAADTTEILLYDEISPWGVTAKDFMLALAQAGDGPITLRINSPGGDVFDGMAIYNALRARKSPVNVVVDGLAASAASFIAMAGDTIEMNDASMLMVHRAWGLAVGNASELNATAVVLDKIDGQLADIYASRTGKSGPEMMMVMQAETWLTSSEAVAGGFATGIIAAPQSEQTDRAAFAKAEQAKRIIAALRAALPDYDPDGDGDNDAQEALTLIGAAMDMLGDAAAALNGTDDEAESEDSGSALIVAQAGDDFDIVERKIVNPDDPSQYVISNWKVRKPAQHAETTANDNAEPVYAGLDLSAADDSAALVLIDEAAEAAKAAAHAARLRRLQLARIDVV